MADWTRRSIAGGPSPATPDEDIPGALHLDFFYRPIAFPCDGAGGTRELESAIMSTTDEAFLLSAAHGDTRMAVAPPATVVPPLQPRQCQPIGTAATGGGGSRRQRSWRPHGSGGRVSCPSSSQLPPLPEHVAVSFVNNKAGEDEGAAMSPGRSEDEEEEAMLYAHNDDKEEAVSSGRSDEDDEAMSSGRGEEDDEAMSSGRGEEDDEATSSERGEENDEATLSERGEENDEATSSGRGEEDYEDDAMSSGRGKDDEEDEEQDEETESEEEEPKVPDKCVDCGSMVALVMLLPCRHSCYCALCFRNSRWRSGPARLHCPVCRRKYEQGHPQSGRLGPRKFK